ncbi:caspase family protein [uncultured Sphaerotilus sp.]|uniref:nSTAND1 domain-containing NTPase n=1 Tax=uncultured Sphaerotilus sp. TaxID=474984 RepID=UPI0030CA3D7D
MSSPDPAASGRPGTLPFHRHHAFLIGIDHYQHLSPLRTAVADARRLAEVLTTQQGFQVHPPLLDATGADLRALLQTTLPREVGRDDRVLFYFAGHGIPADGEDGPAGYLVPADAHGDDPSTFVPMADLQQALNALPCRHLLLILDCCFSGAFRWSTLHRSIGTLMPKKIYKERFDRFILDPAWQVITSAAYDQKALDVLNGQATGARGTAGPSGDAAAHSPFALALFDGLCGMADARTDREGDGVITATELYAYVRDRVEPATLASGQRQRQTPGFFPLQKHDKGEFIFLDPDNILNLPPIPRRSPYMGLASFNEDDRLLFYGRDRVIEDLRARSESCRLLVVSGASGTGKSSVVKAGLLPVLRAAGFEILPVIRPGVHPVAVLTEALAGIEPTRAVLVIDQFEELITRCSDDQERQQFLKRLHQLIDGEGGIHRIILTVRADFEPQFTTGELKTHWMAGRCTVPPFSLEELREVIELPMVQEVLVFDPPELVDDILAEVVQSPGAMPLLSYALNELYEAYCSSGRSDRALRGDDYQRLGGVMGALRTRADALLAELDPAQKNTMRMLMLRMVSVEGDLASKRVGMDDLVFLDDENARVGQVLERLVEARLIVRGEDYIEPAHDALVRAWKTLHEWIHAVGKDRLILGAKMNAAAIEFGKTGDADYLWNTNPDLALLAPALKQPTHWFNAKEVEFLRKSVARKRLRARVGWTIAGTVGVSLLGLSGLAWVEKGRAETEATRATLKSAEAESEKERSVRSLLSSMKLYLRVAKPGSVCVLPGCTTPDAAVGDGAPWMSISRVPAGVVRYGDGAEASRDFMVAREYGRGHVLVYAHDGVLRDDEIRPGGDNLQFGENALRWLLRTKAAAGCPAQPTILFWPGSYVSAPEVRQMRLRIQQRGWGFAQVQPGALDADLRCAAVLWYSSDWDPPPDFATRDVPSIEQFVRAGGGLLVGGLGWSQAQYQPGQRYAANDLGAPFGFRFTRDYFEADARKPIPLDPGGAP